MTTNQWPSSLGRTPRTERTDYAEGPGFSVETETALNGIRDELRKVNAQDIEVTVLDPEVVVEWTQEAERRTIGCDSWDNLRDNAQAVRKYISSKRAIERYQVSTPSDEWENTELPAVADESSPETQESSSGFLSWLLTGSDETEVEESDEDDEDGDLNLDTAHAILGTTPESSDVEIKQAYRKRVKQAHPDQGGSSEQLSLVKDARNTLVE